MRQLKLLNSTKFRILKFSIFLYIFLENSKNRFLSPHKTQVRIVSKNMLLGSLNIETHNNISHTRIKSCKKLKKKHIFNAAFFFAFTPKQNYLKLKSCTFPTSSRVVLHLNPVDESCWVRFPCRACRRSLLEFFVAFSEICVNMI